MIGGKVLEVIILPDKVWVNCREYNSTTGEMWGTPCAIYVESSAAAKAISPGDIVWWQGKHAMWTAKDRQGKTVGKPDTKLVRKGFSGVKRPALETCA